MTKYVLAIALLVSYGYASNDDYQVRMALSHANGAPSK